MILPFEASYDTGPGLDFARKHPYIPIVIVTSYAGLCYGGQKYMANREPYSLIMPLAYWNLLLSAFSFIGMSRTMPKLLYNLYAMSLTDNLCMEPRNSFGTGASGFTLNAATSNILFIDIEWLGVGSVRVGFVINGQLITAHTFYNANSLTTVYMQTANLPIRYEIERAGTLTAGTYTLQQICSSCISEGGYSPSGVRQMVGTTAIAGSKLPTADTFYSIGTIRIKSGRPYAVIIPAGYVVAGLETTDFQVGLFKGVTLAGGSFSYSSFSDNVEYDLTVRELSATGTQLSSNFISGKDSPVATFGDEIPFDYQIGQTIGGTSEIITLAAKATSNNDDLAFTLEWYDLT